MIGFTAVSDDYVEVLVRSGSVVSEWRFDRGAASPMVLSKFEHPARSLREFADWIGAWIPDAFVFRKPIEVSSPTFDKVIAAIPPELIMAWRGVNA